MKQKAIFLSEPTLAITLLCIKGGSYKAAREKLLDYGVKKDRLGEPHYSGKGFTMHIAPEDHKKRMTFYVLHYNGISVTDLAHEVVHLVMYTFEDRGVPISQENDEIFAYHVSFWMQTIMKEVKVVEFEQ